MGAEFSLTAKETTYWPVCELVVHKQEPSLWNVRGHVCSEKLEPQHTSNTY